MHLRSVARTLACLTLAGLLASPAFAQRERAQRPDWVRTQEIVPRSAELIEAAFGAPRDESSSPIPESYEAMRSEARTLLARAVSFCDHKREQETIIEAAYAYRLISMLDNVPDETLRAIMPVIIEHPELGKEIAFTTWRGVDEPANVFRVLHDLIEAHGDRAVSKAPALVAALCVVHDDRAIMRLNENVVVPESPEMIFAYFAQADLNGITRGLTPELLVWVVNTTSARELVWANQRYAGRRNVGTLFHSIQYDNEHFQMGRAKRVTEAGYSLPNIAQHGGVCIDQAFYSEQAGKAIGVPSAIITGRGDQVGHAWVGYMRVRGRSAFWDFSEGRYAEYQLVRGSTDDPQSRARVSDSEVAITAAMYGMNDRTRHFARALVTAERVLGELPADAEIAPFVEGSTLRTGRDIADRLTLLEQAITLNTGERRAWRRVQELAESKELTVADMRRWAEAAFSLAGKQGIEFVVDFAMPLIAEIEDPGQRSEAYGALYQAAYKDRPGVAAEVLMTNAQLFGQIGQQGRQLESLEYLSVEFATTSTHAYPALEAACELLVGAKRIDLALELVRRSWNRMDEPSFSAEFADSSNWWRAARLNTALLYLAGRTQDAERLAQRLRSSSGDDRQQAGTFDRQTMRLISHFRSVAQRAQ